MIGDDIVIVVVETRYDKVRLGIVAPTAISVHREEVYDAIQRENRVAAQAELETTPGGLFLPPRPQSTMDLGRRDDGSRRPRP